MALEAPNTGGKCKRRSQNHSSLEVVLPSDFNPSDYKYYGELLDLRAEPDTICSWGTCQTGNFESKWHRDIHIWSHLNESESSDEDYGYCCLFRRCQNRAANRLDSPFNVACPAFRNYESFYNHIKIEHGIRRIFQGDVDIEHGIWRVSQGDIEIAYGIWQDSQEDTELSSEGTLSPEPDSHTSEQIRLEMEMLYRSRWRKFLGEMQAPKI
jgi:hypothetical protein